MIKNLLLIDDDQDELNIFADALDMAGIACSCTWVTGIAGAQQQTALRMPDIVFLDLNMPRLNGLECLRDIKKDALFAEVPVVLYSRGMNMELRKKGLALGASACIAKSDSMYKLAELLKWLLVADGGAMSRISA